VVQDARLLSQKLSQQSELSIVIGVGRVSVPDAGCSLSRSGLSARSRHKVTKKKIVHQATAGDQDGFFR
jgi:hypothetical protein